MERMHTNLANMLGNGDPDDYFKRILLKQTLGALNFLAFVSIVHRDVKPENILYSWEDGKHIFKLADFGLSSKVREAENAVL